MIVAAFVMLVVGARLEQWREDAREQEGGELFDEEEEG